MGKDRTLLINSENIKAGISLGDDLVTLYNGETDSWYERYKDSLMYSLSLSAGPMFFL